VLLIGLTARGAWLLRCRAGDEATAGGYKFLRHNHWNRIISCRM
jgi:hypothetical protein